LGLSVTQAMIARVVVAAVLTIAGQPLPGFCVDRMV
jgi:hypothetical protein